MKFGDKVKCRRCHRKFLPPRGCHTLTVVCPACRKRGKVAGGVALALASGHRHVAATRAEFCPRRGDIPGWGRDGGCSVEKLDPEVD